ncbi:hypothetical protein Pan258_06290 [Symmachiella dynata]|nr:hypothetical protein Pan258_06290 [Symmachiella dynata]
MANTIRIERFCIVRQRNALCGPRFPCNSSLSRYITCWGDRRRGRRIGCHHSVGNQVAAGPASLLRAALVYCDAGTPNLAGELKSQSTSVLDQKMRRAVPRPCGSTDQQSYWQIAAVSECAPELGHRSSDRCEFAVRRSDSSNNTRDYRRCGSRCLGSEESRSMTYRPLHSWCKSCCMSCRSYTGHWSV